MDAAAFLLGQTSPEFPAQVHSQTHSQLHLRGLEEVLDSAPAIAIFLIGGGSFSLTGKRPVVIGLTREGDTARMKSGLAQGEVARLLRMPQSRLSRMESGERRVDVIEPDALARVYRKPLSYFVPRHR